MSDITIKAVEELGAEIAKLRGEIDLDRAKLNEKNKQLEELEGKAIAYLKEMGKTSYKSEAGTLTRVEKWRVNLPDSPENREKFFAHLREKGIFENMITVNSNTLNSWYMQEWETLKEKSPEDAFTFGVPGISEPKLHETMSFRKR